MCNRVQEPNNGNRQAAAGGQKGSCRIRTRWHKPDARAPTSIMRGRWLLGSMPAASSRRASSRRSRRAVKVLPETAHRDVLRLMNAGDWRTADAACRCLTAQHPSFAAGWVAASQIGTALRAPAAALEAIDRAISVEPANVKYLMRRAQCQLALNQRRAALDTADAVERCDTNDPVVWDAIGTLRSYANDQQRALLAYDRAITLAPQASHFIYNRAAVRRFLGDLEGAEADYDRVIAVRPLDYEAYLNRSELRVQTAARNHVRELQALAAGHIANWLGEVQIRFAFAKEYEDLGEYAQSFEQLRIGSQKRREHM